MSEQQEPGDPGLAAERDRLARTLRETRLQLAMTQARLAALEQSATMELGRTLVRAARRPWSRGVQLPADLVRLWREPHHGHSSVGRPQLPVAAAELFRRMTTRRLSLLRPGPARAYLASLAPSAVALARGPLTALDDFYLANRAGRWSAAARQAYLLRSPLIQPLFADPVVRAARAVPLRGRMSDRLHRGVLGLLCP